MRDFRQIKVWAKAHTLTLQIYKTTTTFPREELYGLTSQLRCAAASIPANIAEGYGRLGDAELGRFLQFGLGSAYEVEYHLFLASELGFISNATHERLVSLTIEVKKMLASLLVKVRASNSPADNSTFSIKALSSGDEFSAVCCLLSAVCFFR